MTISHTITILRLLVLGGAICTEPSGTGVYAENAYEEKYGNCIEMYSFSHFTGILTIMGNHLKFIKIS